MGIRMNGSQLLCESLVREGVVEIFGLPGGAILPLYQTLPQYPHLRHILTRHEQGAAHAADGYARVTGKVGVCWATSGPGATNLVTGIATAQMDSVPVVAVVGQVARASIGTDAFQETDTTGITLPITKHNTLVMDPLEIPQVVKEAFHIANTGRPGPVVIDVPKDVQTEEVEIPYDSFDEYYDDLKIDLPGYKPTLNGHNSQIRKAVKLIDEAEQPVILAGHGIIFSGAYAELRELAEKAQIPVITTLLGISSFPDDHILCVGMPGMHGMAYASIAIEEADLLIALGMRFDDRITGKPSAFAKKSKKIHVDIDPSEIGKNVEVDVPIVGDLKRVLKKLNPQVKENTHTDWLHRIEELKAEHPSHVIRDAEPAPPAAHREGAVRGDEGRRSRGDRSRPASDVGRPALHLQVPVHLHHVGRLRRDGLRGARRHGSAGRRARQGRLVRRRRRRLPDDHVRARHHRRESPAREVRHH